MGGIFAAICRDIIPDGSILEGLRRLLYRGYDGAGVAILRDDFIEVRKAPGHLNEVSRKIDFVKIESQVAMGHVRYASRGWPVYENTHPLLDCSRKIAVIGDGIIENYEEVKSWLEKRNHIFASRTDTEVAAHLLEDYLRNNVDPETALIETGRRLTGNYALLFLIAPRRKLYFIQHGQPVIIGMSSDKRCMYISSDLPSLYGFSEIAYIVEDNMAGSISLSEIDIYNISTGDRVDYISLQTKRVKYPVEHIDKGGFPHFMIKEIYETPEALGRTILAIMEKYLRLSSMIIHNAKRIYVIGTGTSLHAALVSTYYFSELSGVNVTTVSAAEFLYSALETVETGTVVVAISQSGETADVISSVKSAKQRGAVIVGITNNVGSRLALESNVYLPVGAGPELSVPATKTFTSTLTALLILASYTGIFTGKRTIQDHKLLLDEIRGFASRLREAIPSIEEHSVKIARGIKDNKSIYIASSGITYPIALEGALKIKEASLIHAEGFQLGELRHGPLSLIEPGFPIILIQPYEEQAYSLYLKVLGELEARRANIIALESTLKTRYCTIDLPQFPRYFYPMITGITLQLLSYHTGVVKNLPVDTPPGLAKTVST